MLVKIVINKFANKEKQCRYEEIKNWAFIIKRRIQVQLEQYDIFLNGLQRRNWMRLAKPLSKYDPEIVHEFYANAWTGGEGTQEMRSSVRGKWVPFDRDSISAFLGDPLQLRGDNDCTYHQLRARTYGFNDDEVAREICLANHSYKVEATRKPWRILRKHMKTLSQIWMVFMLTNIVPICHVSNFNIPTCHLLYCLLKEDYFVDVAKIICYEIYKFVRLEVNQKYQRSKVNPTTKIRLAIDLKFIVHNCTNTDEQAPQANDALVHHLPIHYLGSSSSSPMEALMLEQMKQMQLEQRTTWKTYANEIKY